MVTGPNQSPPADLVGLAWFTETAVGRGVIAPPVRFGELPNADVKNTLPNAPIVAGRRYTVSVWRVGSDGTYEKLGETEFVP